MRGGNTVIYIVLIIVIAHFVFGVVWLMMKLGKKK